jgi:hypothetical protein
MDEPRMEKVRMRANFRLSIESWTLEAACILIFETEAWAWAIAKVAVAVCLCQLGFLINDSERE